jgi:hypothetical protein
VRLICDYLHQRPNRQQTNYRLEIGPEQQIDLLAEVDLFSFETTVTGYRERPSASRAGLVLLSLVKGKDGSMPSNEGSAQPLQSRDEPTASATEANSANPPRRRNTVNHFAAWVPRLVAGVVLVVSVIAVVFLAGFFTERDYGDNFGALAASLVTGEDSCIQVSCSPAGRYGQHCRQIRVPC